ncbi:hypothetical protein H5410_028058 [Solanum commersonii]|uniref:Uncharacterized protein n=1 Tax=Solanum commersonii TaxID=4109 RepID=A0A9J5Z6D2_SOLCO|nr:hypothetical protein H5410_028058 [Solanum commersonii]
MKQLSLLRGFGYEIFKKISHISLKPLTSCRTTLGLCQLKAGVGYKFHSRLISTQSPRWERINVAACKRNRVHLLPLEFCIGRQPLPLNPYWKEKIINYLREAVNPKHIQIWMKLCLTWLYWYHTVALSPDATIDQLFDVTKCATSWKQSNKDFELIKFGYV